MQSLVPTLGLASALFTIWAAPQGTPQRAAGPAFDVASVKAAASGDRALGSIDFGRDTLRVVNYPLAALIDRAYGVAPWQVENLPAWAQIARVEVRARAPRPSSRAEMLEMLRALLEDRFGLRAHRERRLENVYFLTLERPGRLGPGLHPIVIDCDSNTLDPASQPGLFSRDARPACGLSTSSRRRHSAKFEHAAITMARFAGSLQGALGRPVIDRTGLAGLFDIELTYGVDPIPGFNDQGRPRDDDQPGPAIRDALDDQLGLVVISGQDSVEFVVIDAIERPTPD